MRYRGGVGFPVEKRTNAMFAVFREVKILASVAVVLSCGVLGASAQTFSFFPVPGKFGNPGAIAVGSDGALWFVETTANNIGRITSSGSVSEFAVPTANSGLVDIVAGPDGALWFTESSGNKIGRVTTAGVFTEYPVPAPGFAPTAITAGSDGALWFVAAGVIASGNQNIGKVTTAGLFSEFEVDTKSNSPFVFQSLETIAAGPDGALWYAVSAAGFNTHGTGLYRLSTAGAMVGGGPTSITFGPGNGSLQVQMMAGPDNAMWVAGPANLFGPLARVGVDGTVAETDSGSGSSNVAVGPDGALWFSSPPNSAPSLGRIGTGGQGTGKASQFPLPSANSNPGALVTGPDGAIWFVDTGTNTIGRFAPPTSNNALLAAVLPSSRSVQVGSAATAFATIINAGPAAASGCAISPVTLPPASFSYQTTNPSTNAPTGSPNTPASIPAGAAQSYFFAFTFNAPYVPTNVDLGFSCTGVDAAAIVPGLDTLLLSGNSSPVPDVIVESETPSGDGILDINGTGGANAFALATFNLGSSASITVSANTGAATLPVALTICQSNPSTGQCVATPTTTVTTTIATDATPTFSVFATASGAIPFNPASNRIFIEFADPGGAIRGSTSVAVRTQ
jgi:virginiamycin B lyase